MLLDADNGNRFQHGMCWNLSCLLRLNILEIVKGKLRLTNDYVVVLSNAPSEAVKHFQNQVLKKILKEARRDIAAKIQSGDDHDSVFCLTTSFFQLDHPISY